MTEHLGRAAANGYRVLEHLHEHPIVSVNEARDFKFCRTDAFQCLHASPAKRKSAHPIPPVLAPIQIETQDASTIAAAALPVGLAAPRQAALGPID